MIRESPELSSSMLMPGMPICSDALMPKLEWFVAASYRENPPFISMMNCGETTRSKFTWIACGFCFDEPGKTVLPRPPGVMPLTGGSESGKNVLALLYE